MILGSECDASLHRFPEAAVHKRHGKTLDGAWAKSQVDDNFPMFVAPETVTSQPRKDGKAVKTYVAFDKYLLHIIAKCEAVVGKAMLDFLTASGLISATIDAAAAVAEYREAVELSSVIPEFAKTLSRISEVEPKWFLDAHNSMLDRLRTALRPCDAAKPV